MVKDQAFLHRHSNIAVYAVIQMHGFESGAIREESVLGEFKGLPHFHTGTQCGSPALQTGVAIYVRTVNPCWQPKPQ